MTEHGDNDKAQIKWYCSYWMSQEEWFDVHGYAPPTIHHEETQEEE